MTRTIACVWFACLAAVGCMAEAPASGPSGEAADPQINVEATAPAETGGQATSTRDTPASIAGPIVDLKCHTTPGSDCKECCDANRPGGPCELLCP